MRDALGIALSGRKLLAGGIGHPSGFNQSLYLTVEIEP
jgi:hypothetical protein